MSPLEDGKMLQLKGTYASVAEAVEMLKLSDGHVRRLLRQKKIQGVRTGRDWLIPVKNGQIQVL